MALATAAKADLTLLTLEVVKAVAAGSLLPDKLAAALALAGVEPTDAAAVTLADAVWFVWLECEGSAAAEERQGRLADAARAAMAAALLPKRLLMETGEGDFLEWAGLVVSRDGWRKKEIRANTRHVYTQRKFNLLREESEGYAKLVTLLHQVGAGALQPQHVQATVRKCVHSTSYVF